MARSMDDAILDCIFDPVLQANPSVLLYTPIEDLLRDKDGKPHEPTAEEKEAQKEEVKAVAAASAGKHDEALDMLNAVISKYPEYASAYNNRAQVLRLCKRDEEAMADLNKGLELSGGRGRVAENAYMQRAALHKLQRKDDEARADFQKAAALGNVMAKSELVAMNPYAAMCNQMMAEVMSKQKS